MKSIAFFNNKGGVAKTTSVVNIDYILGKVYQRKVLIVDCDGQQNASRFLSDEFATVFLCSYHFSFREKNNLIVNAVYTQGNEVVYPVSSMKHIRSRKYCL